MPVLSKLETIPSETLADIAFSLVSLSFLGPPTDILTFLLLSKTIWKKLSSKNNSHLYARIFTFKFDVSAPVRRLGHVCSLSMNLAEELIRRYRGLRRIKGDLYSRSYENSGPGGNLLKADLWMAYLMFLENDGKNAIQLIQYARVDRFSLKFIIPGGMFHNCTDGNGGWTVNNEVNALITWLFWFTDKGASLCDLMM